MLFIISKLVDCITSPINWIFFLLLLGCVLGPRLSKGWMKSLYILTFILFLIFTNSRLSVLALDIWSREYRGTLVNEQVFDLAIVAGGSVGYSPGWGQIDYNDRGDRVIEAIRLYRKGRVKKLYLSGEMAFNDFDGISYYQEFLQYMDEMGVAAEDIILERQARTTAENIQYLMELLPQSGTPSILVITSGWHMRRVLKGFEGFGLNLTPYPVDVPSLYPVSEWQEYLPSWQAAQNWKLIFHELLGLLII